MFQETPFVSEQVQCQHTVYNIFTVFVHYFRKRKTCFLLCVNTGVSSVGVECRAMNSLENHLNETQISVLRSAINRIIPPDDFPSGWDAGVGNFFAQLLTTETQYLFAYQQGLNQIEAEAFMMFSSEFASLDPEKQDILLARSETDFFNLLVSLTMEGFYSDPGNGGNKDGIAWKMIGFEVTA